MASDRTPILIGISGVSSSGKTTLARLLRDTWPGTVIIHEDDFYFPDSQIPVKQGILDWDCFESIDVEKFRATLSHIKVHGKFPPGFKSQEDQNSVGEVSVNSHIMQNETSRISRFDPIRQRPIFLVDGFLLYSSQMKPIWELLDVKLFLRTSYIKAKARREARKGYVTVDGFWEDPPGYVDDIVWPNYVKNHAFLFLDANVEGVVNTEVCNRMDIKVVADEVQDDITKCLLWASNILETALYAPSGGQPRR